MADQNPDEPRDFRIATLAFNCCYLVLGVLLCMVLRGEGTVAMLPFLAGGLAMNLLCAQLLQANSGSRRHRVTWRLALCQLPNALPCFCILLQFLTSNEHDDEIQLVPETDSESSGSGAGFLRALRRARERGVV